MNVNSDLGEGAGHDDEILPFIDSASVCCGVHAGSVSETIRTGPTAPKLVEAMTRDTVSPQPTPRVPPGRKWVLMNWAPPSPSRAFNADREPSPST